ncbi:MAG: NUDIX hydrolase [Candidatus Nanohaloarchaea archaeon]
MILRELFKNYIEPFVASKVGRILWPISYVVIIAERKDKVAVISLEKYELPAGMIKFGETPTEAAKRELKEETGLKAPLIEDSSIENTELGIMHLYRVKFEGEISRKSWEGTPELITKNELREKEWRPRHRNIVEDMI